MLVSPHFTQGRYPNKLLVALVFTRFNLTSYHYAVSRLSWEFGVNFGSWMPSLMSTNCGLKKRSWNLETSSASGVTMGPGKQGPKKGPLSSHIGQDGIGCPFLRSCRRARNLKLRHCLSAVVEFPSSHFAPYKVTWILFQSASWMHCKSFSYLVSHIILN